MSRINAFSSRVSSSASASAEQPHQRTHIFTSTRGSHHHPHSVSTMLQLHGDSFFDLNSQPVKAKRVTAPLNEALRAMLCGNCADHARYRLLPTAAATPVYSTSGSNHGIDSATLTDMRFLEEEEEEEERCTDCSRLDFSQDCGSDAESSDAQHSIPFWGEQLCRILQSVSSLSRSKLEVMLLRDVNKAIEMASEKAELFTQKEGHKKSNLQRFIMNSLRSAGYDAAICKTRWEQGNGYPAGHYEFIDVIVEGSSSEAKRNDRVLVDMDFRQQFEIARPTAQYAALVEVLPTVFVGRADKLRDIIKIMCDAAKRSLKEKGMPLPPWRKYRYAQVKWLGGYRRTTNAVAFTPMGMLLGREIGSSAAVKRIGWIAGVTHQMDLCFEKTVREGPTAQGNGLQCSVGDSVPVAGDRSRREPIRFFGLATALAEAACR